MAFMITNKTKFFMVHVVGHEMNYLAVEHENGKMLGISSTMDIENSTAQKIALKYILFKLGKIDESVLVTADNYATITFNNKKGLNESQKNTAKFFLVDISARE